MEKRKEESPKGVKVGNQPEIVHLINLVSEEKEQDLVLRKSLKDHRFS